MREVLKSTFMKNSESEQIWLVAINLEAENGELGVSLELLVRARTVADTESVITPFLLPPANTGTQFVVCPSPRSG